MDIRKRIIIFLWTQSHNDHKVTVKELSEMLIKEGYLKDVTLPYEVTLKDVLKAAMRRRDIAIEGVNMDGKEFPDGAVVTLRVTHNEK